MGLANASRGVPRETGGVMKLDRRSAPAIAMVFAALLIVTLIFAAAWILVAHLG